jgi:hypothetical protein
MTSFFEEKGILFQKRAKTLEEAIRSYNYSCDCCIFKGRHQDCEHCAIDMVHNMVVADFLDKMNNNKEDN